MRHFLVFVLGFILIFLFQNCKSDFAVQSQFSSQRTEGILGDEGSSPNDSETVPSHNLQSEELIEMKIQRNQDGELFPFGEQISGMDFSFELSLDMNSLGLDSIELQLLENHQDQIDSEGVLRLEFIVKAGDKPAVDLNLNSVASMMENAEFSFVVRSDAKDFPVKELKFISERLPMDVVDMKHCLDGGIAAVKLYNGSLVVTNSSLITAAELHSDLGQDSDIWSALESDVKEVSCVSQGGTPQPLVYSKSVSETANELHFYSGPDEIEKIMNLLPFTSLSVGYSYSAGLIEGADEFYFGRHPTLTDVNNFGDVKYKHGIQNPQKIVGALSYSRTIYILDKNGTAHEFFEGDDLASADNFTLNRSYSYSSPVKNIVSGHLYVAFVLENGSIYVKTLEPEFIDDQPFLALDSQSGLLKAVGFHSAISIQSRSGIVSLYRVSPYGLREDGTSSDAVVPTGFTDLGSSPFENSHLIEFGRQYYLFNQNDKDLVDITFE